MNRMVGRFLSGHYPKRDGVSYVSGLIVEENGTMVALESDSYQLYWYNMGNFTDLITVESEGHNYVPTQEIYIEQFKLLGLMT